MRVPAIRQSAATGGRALVAVAALLLLATVAVAAVPGGASGAATAAPAQDDGNATTQEWGSIDYEIVVTADGEVERGTIVWTVGEEFYGDLLAEAQAENYSYAAPFWADRLAEQEPGLGGVSAEDRTVEGGYELHITFEEIDADTYRQLNASVEDGTVRWERPALDGGLSDPAFDRLTYRVEMPGPVTDSNAHEVDGNVATWHLQEDDPGRLWAHSEREPGEDGVPGFGVGAAAIALLGVLGSGLAVARRSA